MTPIEALEYDLGDADAGTVYLKDSGQSGGSQCTHVHLIDNCRQLQNGSRPVDHPAKLPLRVETCTYCDPTKEVGQPVSERHDLPDPEGSA